jgi:hypothetical protein
VLECIDPDWLGLLLFMSSIQHTSLFSAAVAARSFAGAYRACLVIGHDVAVSFVKVSWVASEHELN